MTVNSTYMTTVDLPAGWDERDEVLDRVRALVVDTVRALVNSALDDGFLPGTPTLRFVLEGPDAVDRVQVSVPANCLVVRR